MAKVHFWKPKQYAVDTGFAPEITHVNDQIVYTKHGIVHVYATPHKDKVLSSKTQRHLNYFTRYVMIARGKMWRGKSWGGTMSKNGIAIRANRFAGEVMQLMTDEPDCPVVLSSSRLELDRLTDTLWKLVDLMLLWINSTFPRFGIGWTGWDSYPIALKEAMTLLGRGGEEG